MRFRRCASGVYTISASASGFAIAEASTITVSVGARERIDLMLKVGTAQATTVEVSDVALQIANRVEPARPDHHQLSDAGSAAGEPELLRSACTMSPARAGASQATTTGVTSPVAPGIVQRQRPAHHVQRLPDRRHGQQLLRREQPGLRQPDHLSPRRIPSPSSAWSPTTRARSTAASPAPPSTWPPRAAAISSTPRSTSSSATRI